MKVKCIIIDDEPIARKVIKNHLQNFVNFEIVAECKNVLQAFEVIKSKPIDLIFLDIQMPQLTGIDFLKSIKNPPKTIITTAYRDFAVESYELDIVDYLLKPISFDRFLKSINKYYELSKQHIVGITDEPISSENEFIYIKENKMTHKIYLDEIKYIESQKEYVHLNLRARKIITKSSMNFFEEILPAKLFQRIHQSYIVSIRDIKSFNSTIIELNEISLPISRSYKVEVMKSLKV